MSTPKLSEMMKGNRSESIARRPETSSASNPGNAMARMAGVANLPGASTIEVDRIMPDPDQPRREFDEDAIQRLAESLRDRGQLQPVRVRWDESAGRYVIVVGERRWRAAQLAGLKSLACVIVQGNATADEVLLDQLVENAVREDLKPIEQARAYRALMDARGLTQRALAELLHISHVSVTFAVGLLDLPESVQASVDDGSLPASSAYAIASKVEDPAEQIEVAARVVAEGLNRAETVEVVRQASKGKAKSESKGRGAKAKTKAPKLPTSRSIKIVGGGKVTIERPKGFDPATLLAMLEEAAAKVRSEIQAEDNQAAA